MPQPDPGARLLRRAVLPFAGVVAAIAVAALLFFGRSEPPGRGASRQEIQAALGLAVGRVNRVEMSGARTALGVAVAVAEGVMLTPCAGIAPGAQLLVRIPPRDIPAQLTGSAPAAGLCRIAVSGGASTPLPAAPGLPRAGDAALAVTLGPLGDPVVSEVEVTRVEGGTLRTRPEAAPIEGSPLLDARGRLAAIFLGGRHVALPPG